MRLSTAAFSGLYDQSSYLLCVDQVNDHHGRPGLVQCNCVTLSRSDSNNVHSGCQPGLYVLGRVPNQHCMVVVEPRTGAFGSPHLRKSHQLRPVGVVVAVGARIQVEILSESEYLNLDSRHLAEVAGQHALVNDWIGR